MRWLPGGLTLDARGFRAAAAGRGDDIYLTTRGAMVMPADLRIMFQDRSRTDVRLPVEMWNLGPHFMYRAPGTKRVGRVELDPRGVLPDIAGRHGSGRGAGDRRLSRWPLDGARVQLARANSPTAHAFNATAAADGRYGIDSAPPGEYVIGFDDPLRADSSGPLDRVSDRDCP